MSAKVPTCLQSVLQCQIQRMASRSKELSCLCCFVLLHVCLLGIVTIKLGEVQIAEFLAVDIMLMLTTFVHLYICAGEGSLMKNERISL